MTYKWERLEEWLFEQDLGGGSFNVHAVAEDLGISVKGASGLLQAYLGAQARERSRTLFVLRRMTGTRTRSAMWHVGERAEDARETGAQLADDLQRRVSRCIEPTLRRIGEKNKRALPAARATVKAIDAAVELLGAMLDGREDADA